MSETDQEIKTFKSLEDEIVTPKKCCACGACIAYCESQAFDVIEMKDYTPQFKTDKSEENCKECSYCYYICPQTDPLLDQLKVVHQVEDELGHILNVIAAKTTDSIIQKAGQDGGVVSTILTYLFDTNNIDAAVVSEYDENYEPIPKIIYDKEDLVKSAGTRYSISPNILPLKNLEEVAQEVIDHQKRIYDPDQIHLAFVGTPCQARAISKMKLLNLKPAHVISVVMSLFCFENFDYAKLMDILKEKTNVDPSNIKKTNIKKNFFVTSKQDEVFEVGIKEVDDAVRNHCHECDEFVGRYSDISIGASGAPTGYSMIITRTDKGQNLIDSLISSGYIEKYEAPLDKFAEWQPKKVNWFRKMTALKTKSQDKVG